MAKLVPRQRKHKVLARQRAQENARRPVQDTNAEILPADQRAAEEKARIKDELRRDGVRVTGKKAKRLEKYIDSKLRKDENRELLVKLAARKIDTSLFMSSKSLGQGRETKRQALARALREKRAGIEKGDADRVLLERRKPGQSAHDDSGGDEDGSVSDSSTQHRPIETMPPTSSPSSLVTPAQQPVGAVLGTVGSGLKRPLEMGDDGRPVIMKRQKRGGIKTKVQPMCTSSEELDYEEWHGFASDAPSDAPGSHASDDDDADSSDAETHEHASDSSSTDTSDYDSTDDEGPNGEARTWRPSAFKVWAQQQRNKALGYQSTSTLAISRPDNFVPRAPEQDPLPVELQPTDGTERKAFSVAVTRTSEIQAARLKLPIVSEEQRIMEAIHNNDIVIICGSTGSGKTTQVPQFLFEAGYGSPGSPTPGMIGITQPRRVAAVSMSTRVTEELGDRSGAVAYQIRFEGTADAKTAIKFMTDGVLLREAAQDIALRKYSVIIVDEVHERSVNTDILIGMLSRIIKLRTTLAKEDPTCKPLKLIIMSATLRIEDLTMNSKLFETPPPVLEVEGRQHPVTVHFSRRTHHDYVEEAFRKVSRGHRKLPPGGFLVFLTGRNEIEQLSRRLKVAFGGPKTAERPKVRITANEAPTEVEDIELGDVDDYAQDSLDESSTDDEREEDEFHIEEDQQAAPLKMQILPLYSLLPTKEQVRVFESPSEGYRQIILATNVAETSLTIPGIRFVFDCGRSKERRFDRLSGVQSYDIGWISKASASQRSGRAGRTGPGHCYRLYSSAVYERDFPAFAEPELLRMPLEGVVLQLKAIEIPNIISFPFPTPPERQSLAKAEKLLTYLSAISPQGRVSDVGKTMSIFPLSPRFARILLVGHVLDCLPYTVALVAGLTAGDVFLSESEAVPALAARDDAAIRTNEDVLAETRQADARRRFNEAHANFCYLDDRSDAIKVLQAVGEFAHEPSEQWCKRNCVRFKVLKEAALLRRQITELLRTHIPAFAGMQYQDKIKAPSEKQVCALKQIVAAGFVDQVALRADLVPQPPEQHRKPRRAIDVPYVPLIPLSPEDALVYIHPGSPLAHLSPQECPEFVIYSHLQRASTSGLDQEKRPKIRMHSLTDVAGGVLAGLVKGTPLISYGKPIKEVKAPAAGTDGALVRECWVVPYLKAEGVAGQGWPLPVRKVKQRKVFGKGWVVE